MKVSELMTKNVVTAMSETKVSQLLGKMKTHGIHQIPILNGSVLAGVAELQSIIEKDIDPNSAKAKTVMKNTVSVEPDMDVMDAVRVLLTSGFRALPVVENNSLVGIISDTDLLALADSGESIQATLKKCEYVSPDDDVGKIQKTMFLKKVSRVPVVERGRVVGVVGTLDLIDLYLRGKTKFEAWGARSGSKEKLPVAKIQARSVMKPATVIKKGDKISKVAELLANNEQLVSSDVGNVYIVTPKDILRAIYKVPVVPVGVQITHLNEDAVTNTEVDERFLRFADKVARIDPKAGNVNVVVERHNDRGGRIKFSIKANLKTPKGLFVGHTAAWNLMEAVEHSIEAMGREMETKYGKDRTKGRKEARRRKE